MHELGIYLLSMGIILMVFVPIAAVSEFMREDNAWPMFFLGAFLGAVGVVML